MTVMRMDSRQLALFGASALILGTICAWGIGRLSNSSKAQAFPPVRPAGPEAMDTPPEDWDIIDEQSDGSFPASDPPGTY